MFLHRFGKKVEPVAERVPIVCIPVTESQPGSVMQTNRDARAWVKFQTEQGADQMFASTVSLR